MSVRWQAPLTRGALLLMESLWVYALVAFLVALSEGGRPTILGAAAVVFGSFAVSRLMQGSALDLGLLRAWGAALSLLIFYAIVRLDFFGDLRLWDFGWSDALFNDTAATIRENGAAAIGVPLLWLFWLRGVLRGQQNARFDDVVASFVFGVAVIAFVELLAGRTDASPLVGYVAVPYIAIGLLAIGLSHSARAQPDAGRAFTKAWLVSVGVAVLVIALVSLLFVLVDFGTAAAAIGWTGSQVGWLLGHLIYYALWPFIEFFVLMIEAVRWFFVHVLGIQQAEPQQIQQPAAAGGPNPEDANSTPGWLVLLFKLIAAVPIVALIVVSLAFLFTRRRRQTVAGELKESTYESGRLAGDLGGMLGSLLSRLRPNLHLGIEQVDPVRRLYFDLLAEAAQRGVQRQPNETPLELSPRLTRTFAAEAPAQITSLFDDVRYGGRAPSDAEARRLREEWAAGTGTDLTFAAPAVIARRGATKQSQANHRKGLRS